MERRYDINPWADKLSQVSLPDVGEAWKGMEMLLDKEMPVERKRDKRRWFLLILLLLLLIGVCNCPGRGRILGDRSVAPAPQGDKGLPARTGGGLPDHGGEGQSDHGGEGHPDHMGRDTLVYADKGIPGYDGRGTEEYGQGSKEKGRGTDRKNRGRGGKEGGGSPGHRDKIVSRKRTHDHLLKQGEPGEEAPKTGSAFGDTVIKQKRTDTLSGDGVPRKGSVNKTSAKPTPKPAEEKKQKEKGWWTVGIGLNQFFTVGGQQASGYNSGGISGTLGDYIPVPVVQYHFNRKFYLQLEAQLNSPQYTKKDLVISRPPLDSLSPVQKRQSTVFIKKLFYFNLPLSIHYNVYRGLNLGAGLQFSRLSNGFGLYQDQYLNSSTGSVDTTTAVAKSVKGDSLYKRIKTDEFRFLFDASYTWKHFIFGMRYNQALSKFINVRITPGEITQGRNSSLQLYMRYILWDNRKKSVDLTK